MKALITGASGQLGRALRATAPEDAVVVPLTHAVLDIGDAAAVRVIMDQERPNLVLNAAAYTAVDTAESERETAFRVNAEAPSHLVTAAVAVGAAFVHVSTDFVFDGTQATPYRPQDAANPLSVYGASKRAGEEAVLHAHPGALVVRTAWVYAAEGQNFAKTMLRLLREGGTVGVVTDQIGTPTHAVSLARALWALTAAGATGLHHFTDAGVASWYDFAVAVMEEAQALGMLGPAEVQPIAAADYPTRANRPVCSVLDKTATWALTGVPKHWRAELRLMVAELRELETRT